MDYYDFEVSIEKRRNRFPHQTRHLMVLPQWYSIFCVRSVEFQLMPWIVLTLVYRLRSGAIDFHIKRETSWFSPNGIQFFVSAVFSSNR
jgi:hypothetical protein